jgi:hypothetical protein
MVLGSFMEHSRQCGRRLSLWLALTGGRQFSLGSSQRAPGMHEGQGGSDMHSVTASIRGGTWS